MPPANKPPVVLIIAGNDPSGGAGLAADTQAVTRLGAHPAPVVSALTVQDTRNAYDVRCLEADYVAAQAQTVLEDLPVAAVKLGLLGNAAIGRAVAALLARYPAVPVVLDPVLVAAGGARLAEDELIAVYLRELLPRTALVTPNADEARRLAPDAGSAQQRAAALLQSGCRHVLLKGADEDTPAVHNHLYGPDGAHESFVWDRLEGHYHGSGCTLASAIAALLAHGKSVETAVREAQTFTWNALRDGWRLGRGQYIPNRH